MAKLIDVESGETVAESADYADLTDTTEAEVSHEEVAHAEEVEAEPAAVEEEDLPEKYRGKSSSEIARMHQELEKRLGEQSSEVGELRRAFEDMVRNSVQTQQAPTPEVPEVDEVDFFADPKAAVAAAIANHPALQQTQAVAAELARNNSLQKLQAAHPDMKEVLGSDDFKSWVGKSQFRQGLYQQADTGYDFSAADELLTLFKEAKGVAKQVEQVEKVAKKAAVKKASTGTSRSNPEGQTSRKVYRRRDIIELMNKDPKRYEALSGEIMKAYSEGRVK